MMKAAYEMVHGPHEPWDYASVGFPAPISNPFPKQVIENRCLSLERNDELSEWAGHVTEQLIDDLPDKETHATDTRMVDGGNDIVPSSLLEQTSILEKEGSARSSMISRIDENGLSLITLLLECAVAISVDNLGEAHRILLELTMMASPYGPSCAERVMAYFSKAMASRVLNSWLGICSPLINHKSVYGAFQVFNNASPFIKFAHFTSNQAILEAFQRRDSVHILDLDIMQGLQWPALFHILATRMEGPPTVRMTGTGKQLSNFARRLGLPFEFHPVAKKFGEIDASMVPLRRGETLAVHWLQHSLYDATGPDWKTLRLLEALAPRVITLAEQDISNGGSFLDRFVGSLHYYSALFDSLGACLPCDDPGRHRIEHCLLYREIHNILAIGGPARSGEDKFRHWRTQLILNMFPPAHGYSLVQGDGILSLGWKDTSLFTVSAWTSRASEHHLI
ncbi:protein SCARECROW [Salix suchowensis]|nr:protein SCARECROW [Salix suchowensis]